MCHLCLFTGKSVFLTSPKHSFWNSFMAIPSFLCGSPDVRQQLPESLIYLVLPLITSLLNEKKKKAHFSCKWRLSRNSAPAVNSASSFDFKQTTLETLKPKANNLRLCGISPPHWCPKVMSHRRIPDPGMNYLHWNLKEKKEKRKIWKGHRTPSLGFCCN